MITNGSPPALSPSAIPDSPYRLRSVPYRRPYLVAALLVLLNYCALLSVFVSALMLVTSPTPQAVKVLIGSVVGFGVSSVASLLKRRTILCPLCKGTPLVDSKAHVHSRAFRLFPFNHATTAMLGVLFTQTFRCMYCGSRFDLLKRRAKHRGTGDESYDSLS